MKNKIFTKIITLFLASQTVVIASSPQVLCFGEDGHVQVETVKIKLHRPGTDSFSHNKKKTIEVSFGKKRTNGCGDCQDFPIYFGFFIKDEIINSDLLSPEKYHCFKFELSDPGATEKRVIRSFGNLNKICSTDDRILKKMSFLI